MEQLTKSLRVRLRGSRRAVNAKVAAGVAGVQARIGSGVMNVSARVGARIALEASDRDAWYVCERAPRRAEDRYLRFMPASMNMVTEEALRTALKAVESRLDADSVAIVGEIRRGLEITLRAALEPIADKRSKLAVILHTGGGIVEVTERMVGIMRHFYQEVVFIIPDLALSAGTVLAMSGDAIMMDFSSVLGPIDPQVERNDKLVPALSYLLQWDRLVQKAQDQTLTEAEFLIMQKMDLAELHAFEMARDLSISLLKQWLATYKFKDWKTTETKKDNVDKTMRESRAEEIANTLMKHDLWGSHGRGISMKVLREQLNLKIDDFGADPVLSSAIRSYFELLVDYVVHNKGTMFVHSKVLPPAPAPAPI